VLTIAPKWLEWARVVQQLLRLGLQQLPVLRLLLPRPLLHLRDRLVPCGVEQSVHRGGDGSFL
jgi:hypothetical protein